MSVFGSDPTTRGPARADRMFKTGFIDSIAAASQPGGRAHAAIRSGQPQPALPRRDGEAVQRASIVLTSPDVRLGRTLRAGLHISIQRTTSAA
jgi:hypothetical protein